MYVFWLVYKNRFTEKKFRLYFRWIFFCKYNFKNIFKIIIFHLLSIIVITYSIVILGFLVSQIIGPFSIIFVNILFYMASYFFYLLHGYMHILI